MLDTPAQRNAGPLLVTIGAGLFACTNAASTALYRRGTTPITVYLTRSVVVYLANGLLVALNENRAAAVDVLLLRTGSNAITRMVSFRGLCTSTMALGLSISFCWLTFADAFTVFKGIAILTTILITRGLSREERLSLRELACGAITLVGVALIAQPPMLGFAGIAETVSAHVGAGLVVAVLSGGLSACTGVLTRLLSQAGEVHVPPALLLSCLMCAMFVFFSAVALIGRVTGLARLDGWEWAQVVPLDGLVDWALMGLHCAFTLSAQLATASGYATTRAGIAAFLQLTEIAWVYVLGVAALRESTSLLATIGTAVVFAGAVAAVQHDRAAAKPGGGALK